MTKEDNAWAEMKTFKDVEGREIAQFTILDGPNKGKQVYKGKFILTVKVSKDPNVPPQSMPFEFDFPEGKSFSWARKNFDKLAQEAVEEWEDDQKKAYQEASKKIVPARSMPSLVGKDGKPIN